MYSCSFCGLMLPYPWDLFRNVQAVRNVYKKWKWQIWWKFTKGLMKIHMRWIQYFLQLCHFTSRTSWDLSWILLTVIICFSGRKWYWGEKKEKTEARLNGESLYYYIYINCIIITSYLFIYLFISDSSGTDKTKVRKQLQWPAIWKNKNNNWTKQ